MLSVLSELRTLVFKLPRPGQCFSYSSPHGPVSSLQVYLFDLTYKQRPYTFLLPRKCHPVGKFCPWGTSAAVGGILNTVTCGEASSLCSCAPKGADLHSDLVRMITRGRTGLPKALCPTPKEDGLALKNLKWFPFSSWLIDFFGLQLMHATPPLTPPLPPQSQQWEMSDRSYVLFSQQRARGLFFIPLPACPDLLSGAGFDLGEQSHNGAIRSYDGSQPDAEEGSLLLSCIVAFFSSCQKSRMARCLPTVCPMAYLMAYTFTAMASGCQKARGVSGEAS